MALARIARGRRRGTRALAIGALLIAAVSLGGGGGARAPPACDKVASPLGLDTSPGTGAQPYRTAQKLVDSLAPGETGCLKSGTYTGGLTIAKGGAHGSPITITSQPGERAAILGRVLIE